MPRFRNHISPERLDPFPGFDRPPSVDALSPEAALDRLIAEGRLPVAGDPFWVRLVVENDFEAATMFSAQVTPDYLVPIDDVLFDDSVDD